MPKTAEHSPLELAAPVALLAAVLYLHFYWYSFGIVIFEFLPFGELVGYSIVPFLVAAGLLFLLFGLWFVIKMSRDRLLVLGVFLLMLGIRAYFVEGVHVLWILRPLIGAPLVSGAIEYKKLGHNLYPDPRVRTATYLSALFVILSGAAAGKMQAAGVLSRADYYTIEFSTGTGKDASRTKWIYLGKADNLVFCLPEEKGRNSSVTVSRLETVTPFVLGHSTRSAPR